MSEGEEEPKKEEHSGAEMKNSEDEAPPSNVPPAERAKEGAGGKGSQPPQSEIRELFAILREKLEQGEINPLAWMWHFCSFPMQKIPSCEDCSDYDCCEFGHDMPPIECFSVPGRHQQDKFGGCGEFE